MSGGDSLDGLQIGLCRQLKSVLIFEIITVPQNILEKLFDGILLLGHAISHSDKGAFE